MGSDDGQVCCLLGVCCTPGSEKQRAALATAMESADTAGARGYARAYADWILDNFDLAPKGTLTEFKDAIARLAPTRK